MRLSLVVPCFNEEQALPVFFQAVCQVREELSGVTMECIFVDDGSQDGTLALLQNLAEAHGWVRWLSFSRNFGKEAAMYAGLQAARGERVAILDADLQDPPALLSQMMALLDSGSCDCVAVRRVNRQGEPPIRSLFARTFYRLINRLSKTEIVDGARDFRLMKREMVDAILRLTEYNRFSKGIFSWVGYRTHWLEVENRIRAGGESKWSFFQLLVYAMDGIVAFSTVPLAVASVLGLLFCLLSFVAVLFVVVRQLVWGGSAYGWPSLVCILLFVTGIQLFCMGILGQYLAKTYLEVKGRPIYVLRASGGGQDGEA